MWSFGSVVTLTSPCSRQLPDARRIVHTVIDLYMLVVEPLGQTPEHTFNDTAVIGWQVHAKHSVKAVAAVTKEGFGPTLCT